MKNHMKKEIVIYGAGKIGRGYAADIFSSDGYHLTLICHDETAAQELKVKGRYAIYTYQNSSAESVKIIDSFDVMAASDPKLPETLQRIGLVALTLFPEDYPSAAAVIAASLQKKYAEQDDSPLNFILFTNGLDPQKRLKELVYRALPEKCKIFAENVLGLVNTIVPRTVIKPSDEFLKNEPWSLFSDGARTLPIEDSFKGEAPQCTAFEYHSSLDALVARKFYMKNMAHAAAAYYGSAKGCKTITQAMNDPEILQLIQGALDEVGAALVLEYNFSETEVRDYADSVINKHRNQALEDTCERVGANPVRKLAYTERLIGAALLARKHGIYPYYLLKAAAYAFFYSSDADVASMEMRACIMEKGIDYAIRKYTGLDESDVIYTIKQHYKKADGKFVPENAKRVTFLQKAYAIGFQAEKQYRGCAQGTLAALSQLTGIENKDLFRAATGFSGGMALCGDGVCGGYSGGVLFMSYLKGRDFDRIPVDGDKKNQYLAYECAQLLHDHYISCYGSDICMKVHEGMFQGEYFILRTKARRDEFEKAGAHTVVCTTVVALATAWVAEILLDKNLYVLPE
ncbi:C-GCAxxG-C-C family (seleno)protein [Candidatus Merdisoma sp. HCP28S3_D10]|uniref:C-GCAxxG-C-C family (seleno)protein n=1 Tax=unclassified Candidatus Merdisoma TaxID=3099611 RepID=UPI003F898C3E